MRQAPSTAFRQSGSARPTPVIVTKAKRKVHEEFPEFAKDLAKANAIQLMNTSACVYQIMSKEPVTTLDEFKGEKIALIGRYFGRWIQAAGAVPGLLLHL